ncbi:MAG: TonB-dependent receptor plug domain-containing protein, partial [Opitutales bacterium]|nr:TonB-dependent receptor plug domain-containing protein [Opitutales bacterium]
MNPKMNYYFKRVTQILAFVFILSYLQVNTVAQVEEDEIYELEAFEVYTSSQISAIEAKRSSDLIGSFLGTDAIGDLPDDTLADALTRLPGVNVVNGEEVSVRGLEGKLNSVRINGMDIPQAQSTISTSVGTDTRNFDVSSVPAEIVESISVIKSITPDLDGDSIGGIVDVQTASALALDERLIRYKAEYRYDEMGDESGYGFSLNYGEPISEDVGVYFTVAYRNEDSRSWQTEHRQVEDPGTVPIPELERLDPRETFGNDERFVFTGSLDWQVSKDTRLFAKPYVKIRKRDSMRHRVRVRDLDEREGNSRPFNGSEGVWWFEDGNGNPLGTWVDLDGDGVLGSAGDNFVPEGAIADETGVILDDDNIVITPFKQSADMRIQRRLRERPDRENETYALQIGGETQTDSYLLEYALQLSHDTHSFSEIRSNWSQGSSDTDFQRFFYDATDPYYVKLDAFVVTQDEGHIPVDPRVNPFMAHERLDLSSIRFRREENEHTAWVGQVDFTKYDVMENWEIKAGLKIRANDRGSRPQLRDFSWEGDNNYTYDQQSAYFGPNMGTHDGLYSNIGPGLTSNDGMQA